MTSRQTIGKMKNMFAHWGIPDEVVTDNGTQFFSDEFRVFAEMYGFGHTTSSPYFPQSNGEVERAVQTAKKIMKQDDPFLALMAYRATPVHPTQTSPCQLMMGRQIRTRIPTLETNLLPQWPTKKEIQQNDKRAKAHYRVSYDRRHGARRDGARRDGARRDGTRRDGARRDGARRDGARRDGERRDGARRDGARRDGARRDGARRDGARRDGTRRDGARRDRARRDGARRDGARRDGARRDGERRDGARRDGARRHGARRHGARRHGARRHGARRHGARRHGARRHGARRHGARRHGARRHGARRLPELRPGDQVLIKRDDEKQRRGRGVLVKQCTEPRSYLVQTSQGTEEQTTTCPEGGVQPTSGM